MACKFLTSTWFWFCSFIYLFIFVWELEIYQLLLLYNCYVKYNFALRIIKVCHNELIFCLDYEFHKLIIRN